ERVYRPRGLAERIGRLLDVLQRCQFRRELAHFRARRLSESALGPRPQDFVRTQDRRSISVRGTADLAALTQARHTRRNKSVATKLTGRPDFQQRTHPSPD